MRVLCQTAHVITVVGTGYCTVKVADVCRGQLPGSHGPRQRVSIGAARSTGGYQGRHFGIWRSQSSVAGRGLRDEISRNGMSHRALEPSLQDVILFQILKRS